MYAKQYEITLPADYDMGIIRKRVADNGHILDDLPGLGLKAYLIRERGMAGSPVNQYAPFYLWRDTGAMARFLVGGGGFQNIIRDFGRPAARHWTGIAGQPGPASAEIPTAASRRITVLGAEDQTEVIAAEVEALAGLAADDNVHTAALALDPHHWELVRFVLWRDPAALRDDTERYEVLHLSAPELAKLPSGRTW